MDYATLRTLPGNAAALRFMVAEIAALPTLEREVRREAAGFIVRSCPYRRGGVQLLATMRLELERLDPWELGWADQPSATELLRRLDALREVVDLHWSYLTLLEVASLPLPQDEDYLDKHREPAALQTLQSLMESDDPLAATARSVHAIEALVASMDSGTKHGLSEAAELLDPDDGNFFLMHGFRGYQDELLHIDRLATTLRTADRSDPATRLPQALIDDLAELELSVLRLSILVQVYGLLGC